MRFQAGLQALLIVVAVIIIATVIRPEFEKIKTKQTTLAEYQDAIEKVGAYNRELEQKMSLVDSFSRADVAALDRFIPDSVDRVKVASDLATIIESSGLELQDVGAADLDEVGTGRRSLVNLTTTEDFNQGSTVSGEADTSLRNRLTPVMFNVRAIGTYEAMKEMLSKMEQNAYPLRLDSFEFSSLEAGSKLYSFELKVVTYELSNKSNEE